MKRRIFLAVVLAALSLLLFSACGDDDGAPDAPGTSDDAGTTGNADRIGGDRPVTVQVPGTYQKGTAVPLVVLLHGYTSNSAEQSAYFRLASQSDARGFIYAIPDGTKDAVGNQFWNATDACCDFGSTGVDDSAYLRSVVEEIQAKFTIDPRRIYFIGHSNGGFMSHRMACDHADLIAGIASLAGAVWDDLGRCTPVEPVSVLQIHGTADDVIRFNGGDIQGNTYPGASATVADWAGLNGCDTTETAGSSLDLDNALAGGDTEVSRFETGCSPGGHAELWTIEGGSHVPNLSAEFAPAVIDFLLAHPKP